MQHYIFPLAVIALVLGLSFSAEAQYSMAELAGDASLAEDASVPVVSSFPWDVNNDGIVNIFDLVVVASEFGRSGPDLRGDVNEDDVVNVFDLVAVGLHFGERTVTAAPSPDPQIHASRFTFHALHAATESIQQAIRALEAIPNPSRGAVIAHEFLSAWLSRGELVVTETKLHSNYPNPFNPETWMPYQLAKSADVTIEIYDVQGEQIRTLNLGLQPAGFYLDSAKAAYWNGYNAAGETVASGVYFYRMVAGDYTAVRRMVVVK